MRASLGLAAALAVACASGAGQPGEREGEQIVVPPCHVSGCSGQVCSDRTDVLTTCEWREAYACYRTARCEPQPDGACGWTPTPELRACLETAGGG